MTDVYAVAATRVCWLEMSQFRYLAGRDGVHLSCTVNCDWDESRWTLHARVGDVTVSGQPWTFDELGWCVLRELEALAIAEIQRQWRRDLKLYGAQS
ncbi:hypothetical protein [Deinococcus xianganensis]|uniref:Uncharacterized protein n=1 Tax=Deinococcus xianganensis TaxID=1507289 RepID=A0A6I4YXX7_9DEIO|nr:hypothetical protein [Deinococcus xianganensis]MXV21973.1 hypothetical protein [Deinococcus xianganensis]